MRNTMFHALPAHAVLVIEIEPPVADDERPYVLTAKGAKAIVTRIVDHAHVELTNTTDDIVPFMLAVGAKKIGLMAEALMGLLKGAPPT